ncbi:hypothetical protein FHS35_007450 [Streptomyces umbrinus]|nr:hypothetical protein [Streptomyces umbrinus]
MTSWKPATASAAVRALADDVHVLKVGRSA